MSLTVSPHSQLNEPSQFILGMHQLLACRDGTQRGTDASHALGREQMMIDNFVDIASWAKEYLRTRFRTDAPGPLIPVVSVPC
jgi:hypothetical protein